ncbi:MAG: tRNA-dihydrouridine synthase [Parachlamydiales bacterium]|nr:tRNA-dihydrouridine synthase [Parachlamydiales bacterium]
MSLRRPFLYGGLKLPSNIFCAPLAGCSDFPFRQMTSAYRPGLLFCEMVKIDALIRHDPHTYRFLDYSTDMHPIGAQLCGSKSAIAARAARIVEDLGFDSIDLNCGCPVDKVVKDGSGSGLMKTPEKIGEILFAIIEAVDIPVSVKIRSGWDESQINAVDIVRIAEQAGAVAVTVHGRTRQQAYKGPADWEIIRECKRAAKEILIIGNGDVFDGDSAQRLFAATDCDGILVARGTLGQPWIVEDIYRQLSGEPHRPFTVDDLRADLVDHFHKITQYQPERQALLDMRRVGCWYLRRCVGAKGLRMQLNQATGLDEVFSLLSANDWSALSLVEKSVVAQVGE